MGPILLRRIQILLVLLVVTVDQLYLPIALKSGALYLTSGTARFMSDRKLLPVYGAAWLAAALLLSVGRRLLLTRLARWFWLGLALTSVLEASLKSALYLRAGAELEGTDRLCLVVLMPLAQTLLLNALYLQTRSLIAPALIDGGTAFVERHLLCDARFSFSPLGYIVVGEDWVYWLRVTNRAILALLALFWIWRTQRGTRP
jgi:hypothetical protein